MATTPTSIVNRLMGLENWTDPVPATLKELLLPIPAATTTLTLTPATHGVRVLTLSCTGGLAVTPPAATGTGNVYQFAVTTTLSGGNFTFDAKAGNASDVLYGIANTNKVGTGLTQYGTAANSNLITWDGSTKGGILGDYLWLMDLATNVWLVQITGQQSGTVATPFSNH